MPNRKLTNYPNPFNPTTTISFSLTTNLHENVRIEIYNVKGQLVETLSNLPITNSPNQQIVWNANKFASGVYFYKLVVDGIAVDTKRMILLK
ncbi:MAG: T9SS type A sorting domain-containing protein [Candidatus Cloacimonetes bacterium]|nr:T9SS type A sorting domain-containing protein [Candidatus Cloacimonadota bacterium]